MSFNYSPKISTNGLTNLWDASNTKSYPGSGTAWYDVVGGNNATLSDAVIGTTSPCRMTFRGSGSYDYAGLDSLHALETGSSAINIWTQTNTLDYSYFYGSRAAITSYNSKFKDTIYYQTVGEVMRFSGESNLNGDIQFASEYGVQTGSMYNLHINFENGLSNTYVNGVLQPAGIDVAVDDVTHILYFGGTVTGVDTDRQLVNGEINTIAIYNRPLSEAEIVQNFNALKNRYNNLGTGLA